MSISISTSTLRGEGQIPRIKSMNTSDGRHPKTPAAFLSAPRCLARNRAGNQCKRAAVKGKRVCSLHGGLSPGAPKGKANGNYRHGAMTAEAIAERRAARALLRDLRSVV